MSLSIARFDYLVLSVLAARPPPLIGPERRLTAAVPSKAPTIIARKPAHTYLESSFLSRGYQKKRPVRFALIYSIYYIFSEGIVQVTR